MPLPPPETLQVFHESSVGAARRASRFLAEALGFGPTACEEIALAASELATNLVKHAGGGELILTPLGENGRIGLMVESADKGPGIPDVEHAMADGFSTTGSLGDGLGAVNRLMDELDIATERGAGTRIVCRKWIRNESNCVHPCPLAFGAVSRPRPSYDRNGDTFVIKQWSGSALVGVIDGLGHGENAQRAAQAARDYVERHFDLPFERIFRGADRACRSTRGVVMALARFDWTEGRLTFASVGNIETRIHSPSKGFNLEVRRGVIGMNAPKPVITTQPWPVENTLVLHSDGVRTHWSWTDFPGLTGKPAQEIAQQLLLALAKDDDDATVLVVRSALP